MDGFYTPGFSVEPSPPLSWTKQENNPTQRERKVKNRQKKKQGRSRRKYMAVPLLKKPWLYAEIHPGVFSLNIKAFDLPCKDDFGQTRV